MKRKESLFPNTDDLHNYGNMRPVMHILSEHDHANNIKSDTSTKAARVYNNKTKKQNPHLLRVHVQYV